MNSRNHKQDLPINKCTRNACQHLTEESSWQCLSSAVFVLVTFYQILISPVNITFVYGMFYRKELILFTSESWLSDLKLCFWKASSGKRRFGTINVYSYRYVTNCWWKSTQEDQGRSNDRSLSSQFLRLPRRGFSFVREVRETKSEKGRGNFYQRHKTTLCIFRAREARPLSLMNMYPQCTSLLYVHTYTCTCIYIYV